MHALLAAFAEIDVPGLLTATSRLRAAPDERQTNCQRCACPKIGSSAHEGQANETYGPLWSEETENDCSLLCYVERGHAG
jgi:hypothetical protein